MTNQQARQARGVAQRANSRRAVLAALPGTYKEVMATSGLSWCTVRQHLAALRDEQEIHIADWQASKAQGKPCPVFARGAGEDAEFVEPAGKHELRLKLRREVRHAREASARQPVVVVARGQDRTPPAALMAQRRVFPLAGVWA